MPINYLAVLAASILTMLVGWLWYGFLFAKTWMRLQGLSSEKVDKMKEKETGKSYFLNFISVIVTALVLAFLINLTQASTISKALTIGFLSWLGFIATTTLGSVLWEGKSFKLYLLNNVYNLLSLLLTQLF